MLCLGSLDLDLPNGSHSQKENRHIASHNRIADRDKDRERRSAGTSSINRQSSTSSLSALDKTWYGEIQPTTSHSVTSAPAVAAAPLPSSLGHSSSSGSSVIAAAASQAIAATQQMQQGRRSASLKASYEALQQLTQSSTDLSLLNSNPSLALPISDIREVAANTVVVATTTHSTKKQKRYRAQSRNHDRN